MDPSSRPTVVGYLIAYAVSVVAFATVPVLVAGVWAAPVPIGALGAAVLVYLAYAAVCSLPFALVGIPLVHLLSRPGTSQGSQVAITGAVTVVVVGLPIGWIVGSVPGGLAFGALTALATMTGRAALIPFAPRPVVGVSRPRERQRL